MKNFKKGLLFILFTIAIQNVFAYDLTVDKNATPSATVFNTIQAAVNAVPNGLTTPFTIFIKNGHYKEKINIPSTKTFIQMIGESVANVLVYYDDAAANTGGTSNSASFTINANDFSAFNISFSNTYDYDAGVAAGSSGTQAVAVLVNGDRVAFKNCRFQGNQDTLYQNKKGYYKNCYIDGIIDFIFGGGATIFDSCTLYPKTRTINTSSYITAANTPIGQTYGYVFRDCKIIGNPGGTSYYLGRPWQNSTLQALSENKVVYLNSVLNANILPAGWSIWDAGTNTSIITFSEYNSKYFNATPVDVSNRVSWSAQLNSTQASNYYSNANILSTWDPCSTYTGICDPAATNIAVSNFMATQGVGTATFKWNLSWGINLVKFELFRSLIRNGSYTKIGELTTPNDTTYNYSFIDNALPPGQQVYYYLLASKTGFASHNTDTLLVSTKPTINVVGSLGTFLQGGGFPSASQTYVINGVNLSDNVIITPPTNFEISLNNATWYGSTTPIVLPPTSGVLANTTIYARLNSSTAPGSFSGNILHTTTNGFDVLQPINGNAQISPLTPPAFFRSRTTGNLSDVTTWETSADSLYWYGASTVPLGNVEENVTIMPTHTVTIDVAHLVQGKWTVYGSGSGLGGTIVIGTSPASLTFANNSFLVWNRDGGTLPTNTIFNAGSTYSIVGAGNGVAVGSNSLLPTIASTTVFHHVIINSPNCKTNNPNFNGNLNTINGNLYVYSTGTYSSKIRLTNSATQIINIGGDLIINPPLGSHATLVLYSTSTVASTQAVNIGGNLYVNNANPTNITGTNGTFSTASTSVTLGAINPSIVVGMGVTGTGIAANSFVTAISGTSLTLSTNTTAAGTNTALTFVPATSSINLTDNSGTGSKVNLKGNITINNASVGVNATGLGTININRTDGVPQYYIKTGTGTVSGSITWNVLANAIFDISTYPITAPTFTINANATLRTASPLGINNITATTKNYSSSANYVFNGTAAQVTGSNFASTTPLANTVNNLIINNPLNVTLSNNITSNNLTFNVGKLILGTNNVITNSVTGGSSTSFVNTSGAGVLKIKNVGNSDVVFPVGPSITNYNPITLNNSGTIDNFSVKVKTGLDNAPNNATKIVNIQWDIAEDVIGGSNTIIKPTWNAPSPGTGDEASAFDHASDVVIGHFDATLNAWTQVPATITGSNPYTVSSTTGFTSFSPFVVSNIGGVLSLSLLSFNAILNVNQVQLNWRTTNEINTQNFEIQKSSDGIHFNTISIVDAKNNGAENNYTLQDGAPQNGITFYRLKINDKQSKFNYSKTVVFNNKTTISLTTFPNPITNVFYVLHEKASANAYIKIYNLAGKEIQKIAVTNNTTATTIDARMFVAGIYYIEYMNHNTIQKTSIIK